MKGGWTITVAVAAVTILSLVALGGGAVTASTDDGDDASTDGIEKEYTADHGDVLVDVSPAPNETENGIAVAVGVESLVEDERPIDRYEITLEYDDALSFDEGDVQVREYGPVEPSVGTDGSNVTVSLEGDGGTTTPEDLFVVEVAGADAEDEVPIVDVSADLEHVTCGLGLTDLCRESHDTVADYTPAAGVNGTITDESGVPVEGATVALAAENATGDVTAAETTTDEDGYYELWIDATRETVDATLSVSADGYADESESVEVEAGEWTPGELPELAVEHDGDVLLDVSSVESETEGGFAAAVDVEALGDEEQPIERYTVALEYDPDVLTYEDLRGYGLEEPTVEDENGTLTFELDGRADIETDARLFVAEFDASDDLDREAVPLEVETATLEHVAWGFGLTDLSWERHETATNVAFASDRGTVAGNVTDETGDPIEGAEVTLESADSGEVATETTTDESGWYELTVDAGTYDVTATHDDYETNATGIAVPADGTVDQDIELAEDDSDGDSGTDPSNGDSTTGPDERDDGSDDTTGPDSGDGDDGDSDDGSGDEDGANEDGTNDGSDGDDEDEGDAEDDGAGADEGSDATGGFGAIAATIGFMVSVVALIVGSAIGARTVVSSGAIAGRLGEPVR